MKIIITGGAGYIGSHVVKELGKAGHDLIIYDNLVTGHEWAVLYGKLVKGDLNDVTLLNNVINDFNPDAVIHFAGFIQVEESVRKPMKYYRNNVVNTVNLLNAMISNKIKYLIFSSSCSVYGIPEIMPINEMTPLNPINPYGASKAMVERILRDLSKVKEEFEYISLRYFNVAGADPDGSIGYAYPDPIHIVQRALKVALNQFDKLLVYGTDYPTPDGTCIRDYIHVSDLAEVHVIALNHLLETRTSDIFNCGYGYGVSVKEVIDSVKRITDIDFKVEEIGRRVGDPPILVADNSKLKECTGWIPKYNNLEFIIKTAWEWESSIYNQ